MDAIKVERVVKRTKEKATETFLQDKIRGVNNGGQHSFMVTEGDKTWRVTIKDISE
jgi:hypothetical protein